MTMRQSWIPASGCCGFGSIPRSPCAPFKKGQEVGAEGSFRNLCQTYSRQQHSTAKIKLGCQLLISVTVLSSDPSPLWTLLLCVHIISHLAGATHVPQATSAATASAGIAKDPSPSRPLMPPTAQQCPALEVTWPEVEVPLNGTLTLSCTACSRFPHFSILYWLGNGSFIERLPGRLWEGSTRRERRGTRTQLWRALVLEELSPALRSTNFSCVFSDPAQTAQRHLILAQLSAVIPLTEHGLSQEGVWEERNCHSEAKERQNQIQATLALRREEKRPACNAPQEQRPEMECGKMLWPQQSQEKGFEKGHRQRL
ncbi:interleukin-18-binding protein isoform X4 [Camelus dromedarius]|uniref:interleukin-18-binding protein isoform X4 n=1 Tax=Camelus dromedarius TaxID=9838 RepID=UPI003119D0A4